MKLNNFIHEDYISDVNICDGLIKWFHSNKKFHVSGIVAAAKDQTKDPKLKKSTDLPFNLDNIMKEVKVVGSYGNELQFILERYLKVYSLSNQVEPFGINEPVNIQYYKPYEGFTAIHSERSGFKSTIGRHLAFQTYLNTVQDGGETEFIYQQYKCKAVKGKTLIWPVDWTHSHRGIVSPTEDKYIITGWYTFDKI